METENLLFRKNQTVVWSSIAKKIEDAETNEAKLDFIDKSPQPMLLNAIAKN